jgi:hypothetical protein
VHSGGNYYVKCAICNSQKEDADRKLCEKCSHFNKCAMCINQSNHNEILSRSSSKSEYITEAWPRCRIDEYETLDHLAFKSPHGNIYQINFTHPFGRYGDYLFVKFNKTGNFANGAVESVDMLKIKQII